MEGVPLKGAKSEDTRDRLLAYRADRGWSQAKTAEASGVSPATIAHIETGANKRPRRITLMRLAQAFGVSLDDFLAADPPKKPTGEEVLALQLEAMYEANRSDRERALEVASDAKIARYVATIDRVRRDVLSGIPEYEKRADEEALPELQRAAARAARDALWRHIGHLTLLRDEATGEDHGPPTQEEVHELVALVGRA